MHELELHCAKMGVDERLHEGIVQWSAMPKEWKFVDFQKDYIYELRRVMKSNKKTKLSLWICIWKMDQRICMKVCYKNGIKFSIVLETLNIAFCEFAMSKIKV